MAASESIRLIEPGIFHRFPELVAAQTTRKGGVSLPPFDSLNLGTNTDDDPSCVKANSDRLCHHLDIPAASLIRTVQVHGTGVCRIGRPGHVSGYDALITDTPGIYLAIGTADCYPVLIYDPGHRASAAIHAGWQGTAGNIVAKTVHAMAEAFGTTPADCVAWVGTGIAGENYEVGREVADRFDSRYRNPSPAGDGRWLLDLSAANRDQLIASGITADRVACTTHCSSRDSDLFYSYRRDHGRTGRMLSIIGVRPGC
jgi:YfiH family protein